MKRQELKVDSSNIKSWLYLPEKRILVIGFHSGTFYEYTNVPPEVHLGAGVAESVGKWFNEQVKKPKLPYKLLTSEEVKCYYTS